jgi:cytoskeletal protein RodZ
MLREAREALKLDLAQVAEDTRIRQHFLEAIEAGRFEELPGSAYAPAFLRGYASCVGLDVGRVLQVYRSGDSPVVPAPAHHFPLVAPERRTPRGAMLLASVFLLVGAYVTWHALTRDQMTTDERVPPVPQRLLADQKPPTPADAPPTAPPTETSPSTSAPVTPPAAAGAPPPTASAPAAAPPSPSAAPAPPVTAVAPSPPALPVLPQTNTPTPPATAAPPPPVAPPAAASAAPPAPARTGRVETRPAVPPDITRGTGSDVKPEPTRPQSATTPPQQAARPTEPARRRTEPGSESDDGVTATDVDPTQGNRVISRSIPPARPVTPPSAAQPPQQAALPPAADPPPRPAVKPRTISGPAVPQARTVRAEVDSTLELRGPTGEVLATTYLHAGTTYTVPEYVGFVLAPAAR